MLETRIGGKRVLSEKSSRANSLKRLNCFGKIYPVGNEVSSFGFLDFLLEGNIGV